MPPSSGFQTTSSESGIPHHLLHNQPPSSKEITLCSSQTLVTNWQNTQCHNPKEISLNLQRCKRLTLIRAEVDGVSVEKGHHRRRIVDLRVRHGAEVAEQRVGTERFAETEKITEKQIKVMLMVFLTAMELSTTNSHLRVKL